MALQTSLYRESDGHSEYKVFMIFVMAEMLQLALKKGFSSDLIFCMRAKLSRRLYKLAPAAPEFVVQCVHEAGDAAEKMLRERWTKVQMNQAISLR